MADDDFSERDFSPEAAIEPHGPDTEYGREYVPPFHPNTGDSRDQTIQQLERRVRELEEKMTPLQRIETSAGGEAEYDDDRVVIDVEEREDERVPAEGGEGGTPSVFIEPLVKAATFPTEAELTTAIESAINGNEPKVGDVIGLTLNAGAVVAFWYELYPGSGDIGLFSRTVTEGTDTFRAVGWLTGVF